LAKGNDVGNVVEALVKKIKKDDHQMLTLYYGHDVKEEEANELRDTLQDRLEDIEVDVVFGGQPLYYYILSLE
ncbi:MAG: DAK2 domain-containing protein, partial [Clostridia bacterium]|nr:DAK2 domain-containing protein [Clostridia bacterium]